MKMKHFGDELVKHLANLRRQGVISEWYDRDISAGKRMARRDKTTPRLCARDLTFD